MNKYKILIEGKNYFVKFNDEVKRVGFFTTRFIESKNSQDAEKKAIDLIKNELIDVILNGPSQPPVLYVEEIIEMQSFGVNPVPGTGFTWYIEDDDS